MVLIFIAMVAVIVFLFFQINASRYDVNLTDFRVSDTIESCKEAEFGRITASGETIGNRMTLTEYCYRSLLYQGPSMIWIFAS